MRSKTNFLVSVVRILETPKKISLENNILVTRLKAELPLNRNRPIADLFFWGNLSNDIDKYYKIDDYILIEGYPSFSNSKNFKKIEVTIRKIYPFILKSGDSLREF